MTITLEQLLYTKQQPQRD